MIFSYAPFVVPFLVVTLDYLNLRHFVFNLPHGGRGLPYWRFLPPTAMAMAARPRTATITARCLKTETQGEAHA